MRGMNAECVDLIYLDPPFNSNQTFAAPIGSKAAGAAFKDIWTLDDIDVAWHLEIRERDEGIYSYIAAARQIHGAATMSYLIYMAIRLMEMKRVLKPTGSIYLHCDSTAGAYLKVLMDAVFGKDAFRNEIIWKRNSAHNDSKVFGKVSDTILFYSLNHGINSDAVRVPLSEEHVKKAYRHSDENGRFAPGDLSAKGLSGGGYHYEFHGHPGPWRCPEHRMLELEAEGRIWLPKKRGGSAVQAVSARKQGAGSVMPVDGHSAGSGFIQGAHGLPDAEAACAA